MVFGPARKQPRYEGAWDTMVATAREGNVSAAVVFLPDGTPEFGKHSRIPQNEPFTGPCWCEPLYGGKKPWGCRWFALWIQNVEEAVKSGAVLEVYFFANMVGKGTVATFATAGAENKRRERLEVQKGMFTQSATFQAALGSGLAGLSKKPRADSSSPYDREVHRIFLTSLTDEAREFLESSEGLGNSQKAEVAWLEHKGYAYIKRDVADWLEEEAVALKGLQPSPKASGKKRE